MNGNNDVSNPLLWTFFMNAVKLQVGAHLVKPYSNAWLAGFNRQLGSVCRRADKQTRSFIYKTVLVPQRPSTQFVLGNFEKLSLRRNRVKKMSRKIIRVKIYIMSELQFFAHTSLIANELKKLCYEIQVEYWL